MYRIIILVLVFFYTISIFSQTEGLKKIEKHWYFSWGYTRAKYSKSTIHFKNTSGKYNEVTSNTDYYDFTIHDVTASDKPDYDKIKDVINLTIPQFVGRVGYMFNNKWGIEMSYDHTKYVVDDWQKVKITGQIFGKPVGNANGDTTLNPYRFLHFEHTDGANFWMMNAIRKFNVYQPSIKFIASWVVKPSIGVVFPRTDVTLFGQRLNNDWHVAGWIIGIETGLRLEFLKRGIFEFVGRASYADYKKVFVLGRGNGNANHHFFAGQLTATLGLRFDCKK
jgi:hypothetical protein